MPRRSEADAGLLSREAFGTAVFARDHHRCVACGAAMMRVLAMHERIPDQEPSAGQEPG